MKKKRERKDSAPVNIDEPASVNDTSRQQQQLANLFTVTPEFKQIHLFFAFALDTVETLATC